MNSDSNSSESLSNRQRLLNMIRYAEGTAGADGYRTMFGGRTFDNLSSHPRAVQSGGGYSSDAAGAYQFLSTTWDGVAKKLGLKDFSPESQDQAALELIRQRGVDPDAPLTTEALAKLAPEWASLPTLEGKSYYGQPVKGHQELMDVYAGRRGSVSPASGGSGSSSSVALTPVAEVKPLEITPVKPVGPAAIAGLGLIAPGGLSQYGAPEGGGPQGSRPRARSTAPRGFTGLASRVMAAADDLHEGTSKAQGNVGGALRLAGDSFRSAGDGLGQAILGWVGVRPRGKG